jgi:hypothetical protein
MAESLSLDLIGKTVLETRDAVRKLAGLPEAIRQLQDDQTVMIRMLQAREAEIDLMCALEQRTPASAPPWSNSSNGWRSWRPPGDGRGTHRRRPSA